MAAPGDARDRSHPARRGSTRPGSEPVRALARLASLSLRAVANRLAQRDEPVPPPARGQPGRLVPVGRGGVREGARRGQADPALDRLLGLPLVPRDGARVVRERRDGERDERALRQHQGRPRGAARRRLDLHGGGRRDHRQRRLAAHRLPQARRRAVLRRHVLPADAARRACARSASCCRRSRGVWDDKREEIDKSSEHADGAPAPLGRGRSRPRTRASSARGCSTARSRT